MRRRRYLPNQSAAGKSGSSSSDHKGDGGCGDCGSATTISVGAGTGVPGEPVLDEPAQPSALGGEERSPALVDPDGVGASARQPPPPGVADTVVLGVLVAGGALDGVVLGGGVVVVRTGLGATLEPLRDTLELPLLWYPSVARIM